MKSLPSLDRLNRELATRLLLEFTRHTKRDYIVDRFHCELAAILQQFHADVIAKKSPRVIIVAPPQHGKSELVSRRYPAWGMGKNPELCFIGASYNQDWADGLCRDVQRIMDAPDYRGLFPSVKIPPKGYGGAQKRVADYFELIECCPLCGHDAWKEIKGAALNRPAVAECENCKGKFKRRSHEGRYKGVGRGGSATGRPAHVLIIDDPLKDYAEAMSDTIRESCWEWYRNALRTRMQKGGGILVMLTRWHEDDLIGKLIQQMTSSGEYSEDWQVYVFPAMAEQKQTDWRQPGEALCPTRYEVRDLRVMQANMSPAMWAALYQGRPVPLSGNIYEADKWRYYKTLPDIRDFDMILGSWDCTFKDTIAADFVAGHVYGISGARRYLLERVCEQMSYSLTKQAIREQKARWPMMSWILIEDKANGPAVIDELKNEISGIYAVDPAGGKIARAWAASADQASGNCYLPEPGSVMECPDGTRRTASWVVEYVKHFQKFPNVAHDDDEDAFSQALNFARLHGFGFTKVWKDAVAAQQGAKGNIGSGEAERPEPPASEREFAIQAGAAQLSSTDMPQAGTMQQVKTSLQPKAPINPSHGMQIKFAACPTCGNKELTRLRDYAKCFGCGWDSKKGQ